MTFDEYLEAQFGDDLQRFFDHPPVVPFVRSNPLRAHRSQTVETLRAYGYQVAEHSGIADAIELLEEPDERGVTGCLHHFTGDFVKQSLASMIPPIILAPQPGEKVLDLCAAPGSKTTQLAAAMGGLGELWANDVSGVRMNPLAARIDASRAANVVMVNHPGERLPNLCADSFDCVLADVPCTGLGVNTHLAHSRERFTWGTSPATLADIQYGLLLAACKLVRPGGRVVYSTCSLSTLENEAVVQRVVSRLPMTLLEPADIPGLHMREGRTRDGDAALHPSMSRARRITPWENRTVGFFVAVLEKHEELAPRWERLPPVEPGRDVLLGCDDAAVAPILANVERFYGVPVAAFDGLRFNLGRDQLSMVAPAIDEVWAGRHRVGLPFARRRGAMWRLSHAAVQRFDAEIVRNRLQLSRDDLVELATHGYCPQRGSVESEYPALDVPGLGVVASIQANGERLRWKRARAYAIL